MQGRFGREREHLYKIISAEDEVRHLGDFQVPSQDHKKPGCLVNGSLSCLMGGSREVIADRLLWDRLEFRCS